MRKETCGKANTGYSIQASTVYQFQSILILHEPPMLILLIPVDVLMTLVWVSVMLVPIVVEEPISMT